MRSMAFDAESGVGDATPTVTVRGEAAVRAEPDEAILSVTLSALKASPGPALADVSRRSEAFLALLDELHVAKGDRSTTGVTIYEEFDHTRAGRRSLGHRAAARVVVRLTDPDIIGRVVTRATTELDAEIDGPRWQISPENPVRLRAAGEAAAAGQRKAKAYAEGVGARVGRLITLVEPSAAHPVLRRAGPRPLIAASAAEPSMPIEPGEHEVIAAVEVTFALELD
jgi:uncharacterized protein YggE